MQWTRKVCFLWQKSLHFPVISIIRQTALVNKPQVSKTSYINIFITFVGIFFPSCLRQSYFSCHLLILTTDAFAEDTICFFCLFNHIRQYMDSLHSDAFVFSHWINTWKLAPEVKPKFMQRINKVTGTHVVTHKQQRNECLCPTC